MSMLCKSSCSNCKKRWPCSLTCLDFLICNLLFYITLECKSQNVVLKIDSKGGKSHTLPGVVLIPNKAKKNLSALSSKNNKNSTKSSSSFRRIESLLKLSFSLSKISKNVLISCDFDSQSLLNC